MSTLRVLAQRLCSESGQTMGEYAMLIAVIGLIVLVAALALSGNIGSMLGRVENYL